MRFLLAAAAAAWAPLAAHAGDDMLGAWRITHGVVAPWTVDAPIDDGMIGKRVTFSKSAVKAPHPLGCRNAKYEPTDMPPEGLFQGGLPEPAQVHARALGFAEGAVKGVSLSCDSGLWEFHDPDADTRLFALDNVVWTMSRAEGTTAPKGSPERQVQVFLEYHFNHDQGFLEEQASARKQWFSKSLGGAIDAYFDREFPEDEVPPINGDPFTDSQEYPTRFAVRSSEILAGAANVAVDFADGYSKKRIVYRLVRSGSGWRIDDLIYGDASTFREAMLAPN